MNVSLPRVLVRPALLLASLNPLLAHPGHDDGHELTWDLTHLAGHPVATLSWLLILAAAGLAARHVVRRVRSQSFRGSHARRGK